MLTRVFERDINITINRKIIQFDQFYFKDFFQYFRWTNSNFDRCDLRENWIK